MNYEFVAEKTGLGPVFTVVRCFFSREYELYMSASSLWSCGDALGMLLLLLVGELKNYKAQIPLFIHFMCTLSTVVCEFNDSKPSRVNNYSI